MGKKEQVQHKGGKVVEEYLNQKGDRLRAVEIIFLVGSLTVPTVVLSIISGELEIALVLSAISLPVFIFGFVNLVQSGRREARLYTILKNARDVAVPDLPPVSILDLSVSAIRGLITPGKRLEQVLKDNKEKFLYPEK